MTLWQIPCSGRHMLLLVDMLIIALIHEGTIVVLILKPFLYYLNCFFFWIRGCIGSEEGHVNTVICICTSVCIELELKNLF